MKNTTHSQAVSWTLLGALVFITLCAFGYLCVAAARQRAAAVPTQPAQASAPTLTVSDMAKQLTVGAVAGSVRREFGAPDRVEYVGDAAGQGELWYYYRGDGTLALDVRYGQVYGFRSY